MAAVVCPRIEHSRCQIRDQFTQAVPNVLISGIGGFLQADQIRCIVLASPTELRHFSLKICRNAGEAEEVGGNGINSLG